MRTTRTALRAALVALAVAGAVAIATGVAIATDDRLEGGLVAGLGVLLLVAAGAGWIAVPALRALLHAGSEHRAATKRLARDVVALRRSIATTGSASERALTDLQAQIERSSEQQRSDLSALRDATDRSVALLGDTLRSEQRRVDGALSELAVRLAELEGHAAGRDAALLRSIDQLTVRVGRLVPDVDAPAAAIAVADHLCDAGWPSVAIDAPELAATVRALSRGGDVGSIADVADAGPDVELVVIDGDGPGDALDVAIGWSANVGVTSGPRTGDHLARLLDAGYAVDRRVGRHGELVIAGRRRALHRPPLTGPPVNVFVLSTGRSGTSTFAAACSHFTNFTSGHEVNARLVGAARLAYPPMHIEADNRLAWMLGPLGERYDDRPVLYVHLIRDREAVLASLLRRWDSPFRANITRAVGHGIITRVKDWDPDEVVDVCNFFIDTVLGNIREFLRDRPSMELHLETIVDEFGGFVDAIGAEGDIAGAFAELGVRHNAG